MIDPGQLRTIIRETLTLCGWYSGEAEELLMGIAAHESHLGTYLMQVKGPARGIFQMEPDTEYDIWINYLQYRLHYIRAIRTVSGVYRQDPWALMTNIAYQIAIARVHLFRLPEQLPEVNDLVGQAAYWKLAWNTSEGKGTIDQYVKDYRRYVGAA